MPRDRRHEEAVDLVNRYAGATWITSNHVRGETWTLLRRRVGHRVATRFLDQVEEAPRLGVRFVSNELEQEAITWLRRHDERDYSFVDSTCFALMRSLRIREALAFDGGFTAAGFVELRAD